MAYVMICGEPHLIRRARFHYDISFSGQVLRQINGNNKKMLSRVRSKCGNKTRQSNGLQEHTVAVHFVRMGYDLANDQRQGKVSGPFPLKPDAKIVSWKILLRQISQRLTLDEHRKLPGQFSEDK